jgi:lipid-A-disaccharide synthase
LIKPILFKIKHFTLVNIISDKEVIQELVASRFTEQNVEQELRRLLENEPYRMKMKAEYESIWGILGDQHAAEGAARVIVSLE